MDEKLLEEIRRQEEALNAPLPEDDIPLDENESSDDDGVDESETSASPGETMQTTLFGGDY